jgi:hypothetical protein
MNNYDEEKCKLIKELREELQNYRKARNVLYTIAKVFAIIAAAIAIILILGGGLLF